jgi:hypothetical protein
MIKKNEIENESYDLIKQKIIGEFKDENKNIKDKLTFAKFQEIFADEIDKVLESKKKNFGKTFIIKIKFIKFLTLRLFVPKY